MSKESMLKYLKENFGIKSVKELERALFNAPKLDIGIMTKRGEKVCK